MHDYQGPERRAGLSEEQIELIAERAAEKALQHVYADLGKGVLNKLAWALGALIIAGLMWAGGKGLPLK